MALWPMHCIAGTVTLFAALSTWELLGRWLLPVVLLTVLLVALLVQAHRVFQEIHEVHEPVSPDDLLQAFEQAHADGELDDDEYERVRLKLASFPAELAKRPPNPSTTAAPPPSEPLSPFDRVTSAPDRPADDRSVSMEFPDSGTKRPGR